MKKCPQCKNSFETTRDQLNFYDKISPTFAGKKFQIPNPTLCPNCRQQRRLTFRNQMKLYPRTCDLCQKKIISMYSIEKPYTIFCPECWWSDKWDPLEYGKNFDFNRPFFEQFNELKHNVPHLSLQVTNNENSDYVNLSGYNKDCYLIFAAEYNQNCLYGTQIIHSEECLDTLNCLDSKHCYDDVDIENGYQLFYSNKSKNCSDSMFLYDCKNCSECLFCTNLRNKQYYIFNKPYTKEEYLKKKKDVVNQIASGQLEELKHSFAEFIKQSIHKNLEMINCENCLGDYLSDSKNLFYCFDIAHGEDCQYTFTGYGIKSLMDVAHAMEAELAYEGTSIGYKSYNVLFANGAWSCNNAYYVDNVHFSSEIFGCIGLKRKKYCILNKQYPKEIYQKIVSQIIEQMQKTAEWGEFFPLTLSPFEYNETLAAEYFPLTKEQNEKSSFGSNEVKTIFIDKKIPFKYSDDIQKISKNILQEILSCQNCGKNYKINQTELNFYKKMSIPIPQKCPECRHQKRISLRNQRQMYKRNCAKCKIQIQTTYSQERTEKVYCESCYLKEVY